MSRTIFLTNDDGIHAPGICVLQRYLEKKKRTFFISAPLHEKSGAGHSITLDKPLRAKKFADNIFAVDGTPTDAVYLGLHELMTSRPDIAVSGINRGGNLGTDLTYSGTVSAAIECYYNGITAIAVSLYAPDMHALTDASFIKAAQIFFDQIFPFIETSLGENELYNKAHLINVNIPEAALHQKKPKMQWTRLGIRRYGGEVIKRHDPRGRPYFWIGGDQAGFENIPDSDCNVMHDGIISITPLKIELTDEMLLKKLGR